METIFESVEIVVSYIELKKLPENVSPGTIMTIIYDVIRRISKKKSN